MIPAEPEPGVSFESATPAAMPMPGKNGTYLPPGDEADAESVVPPPVVRVAVTPAEPLRRATAPFTQGPCRVLPHSLEAEEALLSNCILDDGLTLARAITANITPSSFYDPKHGILFGCLLGLHKRNSPIEISVVAEELKTTRQLDQVGGYAFLSQVSSLIPTTAQASYFIQKVLEQATLREIIRAATSAVEDCYNYSGDLPELTDNLTRRLTFAVKRGASGEQDAYTLWRPTQFLTHKVDPDACLLGEGFIELSQWTSFIGIGGLGKTRLALWFIVCQILNRPWCGLMTHGKPQKSVFLSTENGIRRWKNDLEKMLPQFTDLERAALDENIRILAMTPDEEGDMCLGNPETCARLQATLKAEQPGVVIFDPFADMVAGDENKTVDLVNTLRALRRLTRSACPTAAILIIHHARTGADNQAQAGDNFNAGNFGRGSKALYSRVRCEIQLAPKDRDDPNSFVLACGKSNDCPKFATRCVVLDAETFTYSIDPDFDIDAWRDDVAGKRKQSSLSVAEIVDFVHEKCPIQGSEIESKVICSEFEGSGATERTIQRHIKKAVELGYLRRGKKRWIIKLGATPLPH